MAYNSNWPTLPPPPRTCVRPPPPMHSVPRKPTTAPYWWLVAGFCLGVLFQGCPRAQADSGWAGDLHRMATALERIATSMSGGLKCK